MMYSSGAVISLALVVCTSSVRSMEGGPRGIYTRLPQDDGLARKSLDLGEYPEGYYAFNVAPNRVPPQVRKPPYAKSGRPCPGVLGVPNPQGLDNLCGNLNTGFLPPNPMGQTFEGDLPYPFDLIRNKTLDFFSKALPILKEDETLPKVDVYGQFSKNPDLQYQLARKKRSAPATSEKQTEEKKDEKPEVDSSDKVQDKAADSVASKEQDADAKSTASDADSAPSVQEKGSSRQGRALCDSDADNFLCKFYKTVRGGGGGGNKKNNRRQQQSWRERMDEDDDFPSRDRNRPNNGLQQNQLDGPATPCPTTVEYVTPIFARNYQGVWRYIVQIPYEGYFTQTVEVTKCMNRKCAMIEGSCLAAPRWVSLLVSEMFYPEGEHGVHQASASAQGPSNPQTLLAQQQQQQQYGPSAQQPGSYPPYPVQQGYRESRGLRSSELVNEPGQQTKDSTVNSGGEQTEQQAPTRRKRDAAAAGGGYCDGYDDKGCFQVRMYYDWFLVSGSCKCWRQSFADYLGTKRR